MASSYEPRVCVIVPAYNEEKTVGAVIRSVRDVLGTADVVVINDGSADRTAQEAKASGATVITLPFNLGIGGAVQTGMKYALAEGYDIALEIDADGQHDPKNAPRLVEILLQHQETDMVIGSRFVKSTEYRSSKLRMFGIHAFSFLIRLVTKHTIYDSTSGYRAYSRRALQYLAKYYPSDFPEPESIVMLIQHGYRIREVSVEMKKRTAGQSVIGRDFSARAAYFVISNAIAIILSGLKKGVTHAH